MSAKILLLLGTTKGAFIAESDQSRRAWELRGPFCDTWPINHFAGDPASGAIYAGGGNKWFGQDVWKSTDLGETWSKSGEGLAYEEGGETLEAVWSLAPSNGSLYAGVKPAGLFRSDDGGQSWTHISGLQKHPTRPNWQGGGAASRRSACSTVLTAARAGRRETGAHAPTSCPRTSVIPRSGSACIA
jgi:hypothetical protein